jgi:uncharacterized membrane protein
VPVCQYCSDLNKQTWIEFLDLKSVVQCTTPFILYSVDWLLMWMVSLEDCVYSGVSINVTFMNVKSSYLLRKVYF